MPQRIRENGSILAALSDEAIADLLQDFCFGFRHLCFVWQGEALVAAACQAICWYIRGLYSWM